MKMGSTLFSAEDKFYSLIPEEIKIVEK